MSDDNKSVKATHQRSPNYPAEPLSDAITDAKKLFDAEKRTVVNPDIAAKSLGYGGLNGRSRTKIASLRKYGLVENVGGGIQISPLAMRILHTPSGHPDYLAAVREAALNPESFREFYETHREASEQSIQSELILKKGFSPEGAKTFASSFRETIIFAKLDQVAYSPSTDADKSKANTDKNPQDQRDVPPLVASKANMNTAAAIQPGELPVPIADGLVARVPFPMSEDDFELLIGTLQLWKKKLIKKAFPIPPQVKFPTGAIWKNNDNDKPVKIVAVMGERDGETYYKSEDGTGIPGSQLKFDQ